MYLSKYFFIGLIMLISINLSTSYSFEVRPKFGNDFTPQIIFSCNNEAQAPYCRELCGEDDQCVLEEGYCRDCAGTNMTLRNIFLEIGDRFVRSEYPVRMIEFLDFLKAGDYVSITSKSIYNFVDHYDSMNVRSQFQKLCSDRDEYPVVFLKVDHYSRLIDRIEYVVCRNLYDERTLIFNLEKPRPFVPLPVRYSEN